MGAGINTEARRRNWSRKRVAAWFSVMLMLFVCSVLAIGAYVTPLHWFKGGTPFVDPRGYPTRMEWHIMIRDGRFLLFETHVFIPVIAPVSQASFTAVTSRTLANYQFEMFYTSDPWTVRFRPKHFTFPVWMVLLPMLTLTALLRAFLRRHRFAPGLCHKCGYQLSGLSTTSLCPECGTSPR